MNANTPTAFVKHVEASLGWEPPTGPEWKRYQGEARKVATKRATNPGLYSFENLRLAVQLLRRERKERTPVGVFSHVERALDLRLDVETDIEQDIRSAIRLEARRGNPDGWCERLTRAQGYYRKAALEEWQALQLQEAS